LDYRIMTENRQIRVLHFVAGMGKGGTETWLMHVLHNIDRSLFKFDFVVQYPRETSYSSEARSLGCRIFPVPPHYYFFAHCKGLRDIIRRYGPYDVIHCNLFRYSGPALKVAYQENIKVRVVHSHDSCRIGEFQRIPNTIYTILTYRWIKRYATIGLFCSEPAAISKFGKNWHLDPRWRIFPCSLDFTAFHQQADRATARKEFGLSVDDFVVGHVGSFRTEKNHSFIIKVAAELAKSNSKVYFLLVGYGSLKADIERQVAQAGLKGKIIFAGSRPDVPNLMLGAMDVFLFPSIKEGLPLTLLEAQAAGLPIVCSDIITKEAIVVEPLIKRLALSLPPADWARAIMDIKSSASAVSRVMALDAVEKSCFNLKSQIKELEKIYIAGLR